MTVTAVKAHAVLRFRYEALARDGTVTSGTASGVSESDVRKSLRVRGLLIARLTPASLISSESQARISAADLAVTLRVLATLLGSGLSAGHAVRVAQPLVPDRVRFVFSTIESSLRDGAPMSASLAAGIPSLPVSTLGILEAGEAGGQLALAFDESARIAEESLALRHAVFGALAYPALLAAASALVVGVLTMVVIPRFALILDDLGQALPATTKVLLVVAGTARSVALPACAASGCVALACAHALRDAGTRARWHAWLLTTPIVGALRFSLASSRAAAFLASGLATGLSAPRSLMLAAAASSDFAVRRRLEASRDLVLHGRSVSDALRSTSAVSEVSLRLIGAGEISGSLVSALRHASGLEGTSARLKVQSLMQLIEPTLIVAFGGLVAFVALALLQAVYSVRPAG
jgi:general secretion pathway protein F